VETTIYELPVKILTPPCNSWLWYPHKVWNLAIWGRFQWILALDKLKVHHLWLTSPTNLDNVSQVLLLTVITSTKSEVDMTIRLRWCTSWIRTRTRGLLPSRQGSYAQSSGTCRDNQFQSHLQVL